MALFWFSKDLHWIASCGFWSAMKNRIPLAILNCPNPESVFPTCLEGHQTEVLLRNHKKPYGTKLLINVKYSEPRFDRLIKVVALKWSRKRTRGGLRRFNTAKGWYVLKWRNIAWDSVQSDIKSSLIRTKRWPCLLSVCPSVSSSVGLSSSRSGRSV